MAYGLGELSRDMKKAFSMPPAETVRRFSLRASRYVRRVRNRRRSWVLSDADLLAALAEPVASVADLVVRRQGREPLAPAAPRAAVMGRILSGAAPESIESILAAARLLVDGRFDLLGSGPVQLGKIPDWQRDFKSGKRWDPEAYSLEIVPTPDQGHDIKIPWELSRLQHLPTLGIAAAASGDRRFRDAATAHLASFVKENAPYRGVNWSCTMDVALRAGEILMAEGYLRDMEDTGFWADLLKALVLHARFIRENLEDGPVRGNHYLADLAGLYLCGLGLREFSEAASWRDFSRNGLVSEMQRQVTDDGTHTEASTSYHAFVAEMFLYPALLGAAKGDPYPPDHLARLEKMLEAVAILIRPDGTLPQLGDNDDGRFLIVSQYHRRRRDWRPLMALGAYLFRRPEWLTLSGDAWVEGAWIIGEPFLRWRHGSSRFGEFPPFRSRAFPGAGWYQLAEGPVQMVVDAGPVGQGGQGGHAHNDTLAFDLYSFGEEILPDRGTGIYTPDLAVRNRFRSTVAHNAIQVDREEINPLSESPFRLTPSDTPRVLRWREGSRRTYLSAEHSGYGRLPAALIHRRSILLDRTRRVFTVKEVLQGRGRHRFTASFHLPPGWAWAVAPEERGWVACKAPGGVGIRFEWVRRPAGARCRIEEDLHSPSYGVVSPASAIRTEWEGEAPVTLTSCR